MKILKGILKESKQYYLDIQKKINKKLSLLPNGSIKERIIHGNKYYYLQYRDGKKVLQKYLGKIKPKELLDQIKERKNLQKELKKVEQALRLLRRTERKKRGCNN